MGQTLWIYGAGGHGLVVAEAAKRAGLAVAGFIDDGVASGTDVGPWEIVGTFEAFKMTEPVVVAVGDNSTRQQLIKKVMDGGGTLVTVVDPSAVVSDSAELGAGVFVSAGAVIHARAKVGCGAVINTRAVVEHDARVGEATHIGPGAILCGEAQVGTQVLMGAGSVLLPAISVGDGAIVGAGAVVTRPVAAGRTVVGVPAVDQG